MVGDLIEKYRSLRGDFFDLFIPDYINSFYLATIILLAIVLFEWRNIKDWDNLQANQKGLLRALIFVTLVSIIGSFLMILGVI